MSTKVMTLVLFFSLKRKCVALLGQRWAVMLQKEFFVYKILFNADLLFEEILM